MKAYLLRAFLSSSRYFKTRPFILSLQARRESTTEKYPHNFLIISGTFWPSLGHLGRQHHVLASVWPSKRHFLEIQGGID